MVPREELARRPAKARLDDTVAYAAVWEEERRADGRLAPTAVLFLTNRECPFRCVMCDLWVHTVDHRVPDGAVLQQIDRALAQVPHATQIKLYNAGSFFDPEAIPPAADRAIAARLAAFDRVIVEAHPAFLRGVHGDRCLRFRDALRGALEVAVGLETAHPDVLARLNKKMTLEAFEDAAAFLGRNGIALRTFILLKPPFMDEEAGVEWACRSLDVAAACGATASSIIPTRGGPWTVAIGEPFTQPSLRALERAVEYGLSRARGRVFADLWDVERFFTCECSPRRAARLHQMNRDQCVPDAVACHRDPCR